MLLYLAGPAVQDIFNTLSDTGEAKYFEIAHYKLTEYFTPKKNVTCEVYVFRQVRQHEKETLAQFETRLRKPATTCKFTDTEGEIKNQIIQQCTNSKIRRRALHEPTRKLADILDLGRSFETGNGQATEIEMSLNSMSKQDSHKTTVTVNKEKKVAKTRATVTYTAETQTKQSPVTTVVSGITRMAPARQESRRVRPAKNTHYARCCRSTKTQTGKQNAQPGRIKSKQCQI